MSIKIESNRWKKVPNSIYCTAEYRGISKVLVIFGLNIKRIIAMLKNKYIAEKAIEKREIFFS